jgi:branched-chain amino acid transport system substrate-binding protein
MDRRRWSRVGALVAVVGAGVSCSLLLGDFKECQSEADCAGRSDGGLFTYICESNHCLPIDKRCTILGPSTGEAVVLGAIQPKTRRVSDGGYEPHQWGPWWEKAISMVVDELNPPSRNGIRNMPIRIYSCDSQTSSATAAELATYLVDNLGVQGIITDGSGETIAESRITVGKGVLLISGAATSGEITNLSDLAPDGSVGLVWRTTPSDALQAPVIARQVLDGGVTKKMFVFVRDDAYGQAFGSSLGQAYPQQLPDGGDAHDQWFVKVGGEAASVQAALTRAQQFQPEVMVIIGFPEELVPIVNGSAGYSGLNSAKWFFTQSGKFPGLFSQITGGVPIEGSFGTSPASGYPDSVPSLFFRPKYLQNYGQPWDYVVDLANLYDATFLMAVAADYSIGKVGRVDGTTMAHALTRISDPAGAKVPLVPSRYNEITQRLNAGETIDIEGASGHLDFVNSTGEAPADIEVWRIEGQNFITVGTFPP